MIEQIGYTLLTVAELFAATLIFLSALNPRMGLYPAWHKIGLGLAMLGMTAQAWHNIVFLTTGVKNSGVLPYLTQIGIAVIVATYVPTVIKNLNASKQAKPKKG